jgi:hypothetical protein
MINIAGNTFQRLGRKSYPLIFLPFLRREVAQRLAQKIHLPLEIGAGRAKQQVQTHADPLTPE